MDTITLSRWFREEDPSPEQYLSAAQVLATHSLEQRPVGDRLEGRNPYLRKHTIHDRLIRTPETVQ
ncbi:hypothetical protein [Shimazuella alba]|uniref:Uncharacterized protein n=1 Tax=Shimazuella alba TaxID=2690964 RepID=A0A6I4VR47_9BACL|nr:hypothetical protein [Shimazuella alba]MXQ52878.1 hypothetical protein [Shimazuella alba]